MHRMFLLSVLSTLGVLSVSGCGPLDRPMPARLDDEGQKEVDAAWNAALAPVGKYDRQRWLDALVGSQAYQNGVDSLTFRSEKAFAGGRVVMEVFFERAKPEEDRFVVTVLNQAGVTLRQEKYNRTDVEQTARELSEQSPPPQPTDPPEVVKRRAALEARWNQITEMLPKQKDSKK